MDLEQRAAQNIIFAYKERIDYGLSLTDTKGIVVASTDAGRVGTFIELAYSIVAARRADAVRCVNSSDYLGTPAGVAMVLRSPQLGELCGAFHMSGDPDRLFPLAPLMQASIETALGYELRDSARERSRDLRSGLYSALVNGSSLRESELEAWAWQFGIDSQVVRMPLLISAASRDDSKLYNELGTTLRSGDILTYPEDGRVILFKAFDQPPDELPGSYKNTIREQFERCAAITGAGVSCCAGSFVRHMPRYHTACRHCRWLMRETGGAPGLSFFYDRAGPYLIGLISPDEMYGIFSPLAAAFSGGAGDDFVRVILTLDRNNYNLVRSSAELFMHKNTLSSMLERIKNLTDTDPIHNSSDRKLLLLLAHYMSRIEGHILPHRGA